MCRVLDFKWEELNVRIKVYYRTPWAVLAVYQECEFSLVFYFPTYKKCKYTGKQTNKLNGTLKVYSVSYRAIKENNSS